MKVSNVIVSSKDYEILLFLWRWKIATTRVIEAKFYPQSKGTGAYFRLWRLERAGFVRSKCSVERKHSFWILTDKGFSSIKSELGVLVEEGYNSENFKHDLFVAAAHLGEFMLDSPEGVALCSEQELRRLAVESLPSWAPKSKIHRPDGYWHISSANTKRLLALEVELSQKHLELYENIARYYLEDTEVNQVIWIVKKPQQAQSIHERIASTIRSNPNIHSFILLADFVVAHWQAKVTIGKSSGSSIADLLALVPQQSRKTPCGQLFFDTRKIPINSVTKRNLETLTFVN